MPPLSRQTVTTLLTSAWTILEGGVRIFALDSLKEGFIDIRPLPRVAQFLSVVGLISVFVFIASIFFNDPLRWSGTLELLPLSSAASHGLGVPSTAVALTYLATILAWTFMLTGALHVRAVVRWGVLVCLFSFGFPGEFLGALQGVTFNDPFLLLITFGAGIAAILLLLIALIILPRIHLPLTVEFVLMLALLGVLYGLNFYVSVETTRQSHVDFVSGYLVPDVITGTRILIIPFLYLAGAEMMNFGVSFTRWGVQSAQRFGRDWVLLILLVALLVYRWIDVAVNHLLPGVSLQQAQAWGGALLAGMGLIPIALWRARHPPGDRVPLKLVVGLILVAIVPQFALLVALNLAVAIYLALLQNPGVLSEFSAASALALSYSNALREHLFLTMAVAGVITTVVALRWKRYTVAAYGMLLAWLQLVWWFMESGRPLQDWRYHYQDLDPWVLLVFTGLGIFWWWRNQLDKQHVLTLLALTFFAWVLNFVDFLDNPLALFFGFAGIFFVAFGILWSVLTAGGKFANYDSRQFPRLDRILLYLGYALLTLNVTHWITVTHDIEQQILNSAITLTGLRIFGFTAAYLVFVEGGRALLRKEGLDRV